MSSCISNSFEMDASGSNPTSAPLPTEGVPDLVLLPDSLAKLSEDMAHQLWTDRLDMPGQLNRTLAKSFAGFTSALADTELKDSILDPLTVNAAGQLIKTFDQEEINRLKSLVEASDWASLANHQLFRKAELRLQSISSELDSRERLIAVHAAWSDDWLGNDHILFADLMDRLRKNPYNPKLKPYNHAIFTIQSSGMGKSRLMDSVAKLKFCFPFNMRDPSKRAYPPCDENIYDFFRIRHDNDDVTTLRFTAFFVALFDKAVAELEKALITVTAGSIPERWREYLAIGSTNSSVGRNRKVFYNDVTDMAENLVRGSVRGAKKMDSLLQEKSENFILKLRHTLRLSTLTSDIELSEADVLVFDYFDEAHILVEIERGVPSRLRSKFHLLQRVLAKMNHVPAFSVSSWTPWRGTSANG